jgi:ABC-2 type transport system ATP-binding protein
MDAVGLLESAPGVKDVALYGTTIHVLIDSGHQSSAGLRAWLTTAGVDVHEIAPILPSLEDVFISLIGAQ